MRQLVLVLCILCVFVTPAIAQSPVPWIPGSLLHWQQADDDAMDLTYSAQIDATPLTDTLVDVTCNTLMPSDCEGRLPGSFDVAVGTVFTVALRATRGVVSSDYSIPITAVRGDVQTAPGSPTSVTITLPAGCVSITTNDGSVIVVCAPAMPQSPTPLEK